MRTLAGHVNHFVFELMMYFRRGFKRVREEGGELDEVFKGNLPVDYCLKQNV